MSSNAAAAGEQPTQQPSDVKQQRYGQILYDQEFTADPSLSFCSGRFHPYGHGDPGDGSSDTTEDSEPEGRHRRPAFGGTRGGWRSSGRRGGEPEDGAVAASSSCARGRCCRCSGRRGREGDYGGRGSALSERRSWEETLSGLDGGEEEEDPGWFLLSDLDGSPEEEDPGWEETLSDLDGLKEEEDPGWFPPPLSDLEEDPLVPPPPPRLLEYDADEDGSGGCDESLEDCGDYSSAEPSFFFLPGGGGDYARVDVAVVADSENSCEEEQDSEDSEPPLRYNTVTSELMEARLARAMCERRAQALQQKTALEARLRQAMEQLRLAKAMEARLSHAMRQQRQLAAAMAERLSLEQRLAAAVEQQRHLAAAMEALAGQESQVVVEVATMATASGGGTRHDFDESSSPVPADRRLIDALPRITVVGDGCAADSCCPICCGEYLAGEQFTALPCKHGFHRPCVAQWLRKSGTCPVCRYALT